jgi:filamentous hemagglutinin family protein
MKILRRNYLGNAIATFILANAIAGIPQQTFAQPTADATLPTPSFVDDASAPFFRIIDGTTAGSNLFHSFSQFSLLNGETVFFDNLPTIQNILVRVTGNSISSINGLISANGNTNLFLINPNGIIFGQNASLAIGGSFLATTANSVRFLDGSEFHANANAQTTLPLLLVTAPVGLQFNGLTNGAIATTQSLLDVQTGRTLALVGGDVTLQGATLEAGSGRIELGSIAGNGAVAIAQTVNGLSLNYDQVPNLGNIRLEQASVADTSGNNGGGDIQVQGRQVILDGGSILRSRTLGNGNGRDVFVRATELFAVRESLSGIFTNTRSNSSGNASNITISTQRLELTNSGRMIADTSGSGKGGEIRINASNVILTGIFGSQRSAIYSQTNSTGNSGNIIITTDNLFMNEKGEISSATMASGNAGNIDIMAKNINLISNNQNNDFARINSGVPRVSATGDGGVLKITTDNIQLTGGSTLVSSSRGSGNAGGIDITAKSIFLDSSNSSSVSRIVARTISEAGGTGGTGNAGNVKITADSVVLKDGGQISVNTETDSISNGNAGNLSINAKLIDIFGQNDNNIRSGLFANVTIGNRNGGNIVVNSDRLIVRDGGIISASNFNTSLTVPNPSSVSSSSAGNITINSPSILLDQGSINVNSFSGSRGNINLNSNLILLRNGSTISANAFGSATGGNITINTALLVAIPTENSDITATSLNNFGGRVIIADRGVVIGFQFVDRLTPRSDITASSALGSQFNGLVAGRTFDKLVNDNDLTDRNKPQIVAACDRLRDNEFIITGRGGVPSDATKVISSQAIWRDLRLSEIPSTPLNPTAQTEPNLVYTQPTRTVAIQPIPQIEAQSWEIDGKGRLKLLAYALDFGQI